MIQTKLECIGCFALHGELHQAYTCPAHGNHPLAAQFRKDLLDASLRETTPKVRVDLYGEDPLFFYGDPGPLEKQALDSLNALKKRILESMATNDKKDHKF